MTNPELLGKLETLIREGDEVDRCYTIQSLVKMQHRGANSLLLECLQDADIDVCVDAANALAELGDDNSSEKLLESLLKDPDGEVKTACIRALAKLGEAKAIPHFLKIIEHRPDDILYDTNEWDFWWDMQLECIKALGEMHVSDAVPVLQRVLESEELIDVEEQIFKALTQMGADGDALLIKLLESSSARSRRRVARALGQSESSETLKSLARALRDEEPEVRVATLNSLAHRQQAVHYLPIVLFLFNDPDAGVRDAAIKLAKHLSAEQQSGQDADYSALIEKLLPLLDDPDPRVKSTVLETLTHTRWQSDEKTANKVVRLLNESEGDCFRAACQFVVHYHIQAAIEDLLLRYKKNALGNEEKCHALISLGALQQWDEKIQALLSSALHEQNKSVRISALEALAALDKDFPDAQEEEHTIQRPFEIIHQALSGRLSLPLTLPSIPVSMGDASPGNACAGKPDIEDDTSSGADSENTLSETDAFVADAMDQISTSIRDGETPVPLSTLDSMAIRCVEDKLEAQSREEAEPVETSTLSEQEKQELEKYLDITRANTETANWLFSRENVSLELDIQRLAARILGNIGSPDDIPALLDICEQNDSGLRTEAILSIGRLAENRKLPEQQEQALHRILLQSLSDSHRDLRIAAIRVLGQRGTNRDIEQLTAMLEDREVSVRIYTVHALGNLALGMGTENMDSRSMLEQLLSQLEGNETGVHRAVAEAIVPLFKRLNGDAGPLKYQAIEKLINSGLAGTDGQVKEMSRGLGALSVTQSSDQLLARLDALQTSVERRYVVEMLAELHRPAALH